MKRMVVTGEQKVAGHISMGTAQHLNVRRKRKVHGQ